MDRGQKARKLLVAKNSKLYKDLDDIIKEHVLPFLPAKSIFRFQGVCRDWKLQISTPFFAHNQSLSYRGISGIFCQRDERTPSFIYMDPKSCGVPDPSLEFLPFPVDIRSSSNGLLCCRARVKEDTVYYICNPVTKQWKRLPKPNADHGPDPAVVLVFDPSLLNFAAEYKLVCAFPSADFDDANEFEIYSSKEGSWKASGEIRFGNKVLIPNSGVHVNGIVYWKIMGGGIVSYDMIKDRTQLIRIHSNPNSTLGIMDGKLCAAYTTRSTVKVSTLSNVHSNTMQMGSNVIMWEHKYAFQLHHSSFSVTAPDRRSVAYIGDGLVLVQKDQMMFSYDIKKKETKLLSSNCDYNATTVPYVNSLTLL